MNERRFMANTEGQVPGARNEKKDLVEVILTKSDIECLKRIAEIRAESTYLTWLAGNRLRQSLERLLQELVVVGDQGVKLGAYALVLRARDYINTRIHMEAPGRRPTDAPSERIQVLLNKIITNHIS